MKSGKLKLREENANISMINVHQAEVDEGPGIYPLEVDDDKGECQGYNNCCILTPTFSKSQRSFLLTETNMIIEYLY